MAFVYYQFCERRRDGRNVWMETDRPRGKE